MSLHNEIPFEADNSPDLDSALTYAIIDAFGAHTRMSKQALREQGIG